MSSHDKHLIEIQQDSEELFKGRLLHAFRDTVTLPDGGTATREYVVHPGAVVIVPLLDDGRVLLERQFRYPVGRVMIEFPAGKLDAGEDKLACAKRELLASHHCPLNFEASGKSDRQVATYSLGL